MEPLLTVDPETLEPLYCTDDRSEPYKYDLRQEGWIYRPNDIKAWRTVQQARLLALEKPAWRGKHTKEQHSLAWKKTKLLPDFPINKWKPLQDGPCVNRLIQIYRPLFGSEGWKADMLMSRLWEILTGQPKGKEHVKGKGNRGVFLRVVILLLLAPDKKALADALFSVSTPEAITVNFLRIPTPLRPFFDITTKVDGRGEVLTALWFSDQHWWSGTGTADAKDDEGRTTNIKEFKSVMTGSRMGASSFTNCKASKRLVKLSETQEWVQDGDTLPSNGLTDKMLAANRALIDAEFKDPTFEELLNREYLESEAETCYVFFFQRGGLRARLLKDTHVTGATKNDFQAAPNELPESLDQNVTDVAA